MEFALLNALDAAQQKQAILGYEVRNLVLGPGTDGKVITSNACESFFSQLKRSIDGTHHHVSREHLHRYLAEFDFRYTNRAGLGCNDADRADLLLAGVVGKRLTYRTIGAR